jgi:hypothetical protein
MPYQDKSLPALQLPPPKLYISVYTSNKRDLSITEFRRQCLALMKDLPEEGIVITKPGQPLARVAPVRERRRGERVTPPLLKGKGAPRTALPQHGDALRPRT